MNRTTKRIATTGVTAAAYVVLTLIFAFISFKEVQFRIAELLNLLVFINPIFAPGVILGCFLANLSSPFGVVDWVVGTFATSLAVLWVSRSKNLFIACLGPVVCNVLVGIEIFFFMGAPFTLTKLLVAIISVAIGEFTICVLCGYPVMSYIMKDKRLMDKLKAL